jgi:D-alanine-D-alanine ligase-like ATP-grasp enzyme
LKFGETGISVDEHLIPRMKDLIIDTFLAIKSSMNPSKRKNCFELVGYDFMIDEDFRVWLIEVNTNPQLPL